MKKLFFAFIVFISVFTACKKDDPAPVVDFTFSIIGNFSPCKVEFYTTSVGDSYQWTFTGASTTTSIDKNPAVTFSAPGTYKATLKVNGSTELTKSVVIPPKATKLKIKSITLTSYPLLKSNGGSFDVFPNSGPDISFKILGVNPNNTLLYDHDQMFQDISSVQNLKFAINNGVTLSIVDDFYFLRVIDSDSGLTPDVLGDVSFNPSAYTTILVNYPPSFSKTQNGITAIFDVEWQ